MRQVASAVALLSCSALLKGCITSQFPLLDDKSLVIDPSLTGRYEVTENLDMKPSEFEIYLNRKAYYLVSNGKLVFITTLHKWAGNGYLGELRGTAEPGADGRLRPASYVYLLITKTDKGADLNLIQCETHEGCEVKSATDLLKFAAEAEQNPQFKQLGAAIKKAELGR
jgi:hypothetical protein